MASRTAASMRPAAAPSQLVPAGCGGEGPAIPGRRDKPSNRRRVSPPTHEQPHEQLSRGERLCSRRGRLRCDPYGGVWSRNPYRRLFSASSEGLRAPFLGFVSCSLANLTLKREKVSR